MKKETVLLLVIGILIGALLAVIFFNMQNRSTAPSGAGTAAAPPSVPAVDFQQQVSMLEGILAREPNNRNAWVELGNKYFDADQPMKAVDAYAKALELQPDDPNVLTDQGAMYRRLGWFDKAIHDFEEAYRLDPNHQQSLYNLGIVYRYDLQDFPKAIDAWEKFLAIAPNSPAADKIRAEIDFMKNHPPLPQPQ